jgi:DNA polymerase
VLETLSKALRAMIVAEPGKRLVGADLSNIEGRINAWIAGETWKTQAFSEYDNGTGPDLYKLAYAKSFHKAPEAVDKAERQVGKVMELALGYQGGVGAFQTMATAYGLKVTDDRAEELKAAWRDAHPEIVQSWWDLQDAAIDAGSNKGCIVPLLNDRIRYKVDRGFLWCRLPSNRVLAYAAPRIVWGKVKCRDGSVLEKRQVEYEGVDSVTKRWGPQRLYGGLQCENIVQAIARDVIVEAMFRAEEAGFPIILTVHDEILAEVEDAAAGHTPETLEALMTQPPKWASGLPLAAKAWEDKRYVK